MFIVIELTLIIPNCACNSCEVLISEALAVLDSTMVASFIEHILSIQLSLCSCKMHENHTLTHINCVKAPLNF